MVSPCLPRRKLLSLAERLALLERPGVGRLIGPERAVEGGLEPFSGPPFGGWRALKAVRDAVMTLAKAWVKAEP